jgi:hypothetical protein
LEQTVVTRKPAFICGVWRKAWKKIEREYVVKPVRCEPGNCRLQIDSVANLHVETSDLKVR